MVTTYIYTESSDHSLNLSLDDVTFSLVLDFSLKKATRLRQDHGWAVTEMPCSVGGLQPGKAFHGLFVVY